MSKLIYIADDEDNIRFLVKTFLENNGYEVEDFDDGDKLLTKFNEKPCDMVILDVMMPGSDGFEICRKIREKSIVPIIMLTARDTDIDYITGITLGSDDYFTKPFSPMSLVMRVKAIFRRIDFEHAESKNKSEDKCELKYGSVKINIHNKTITYKEQNIDLTPNEYNFLIYLFENSEKAVSRDELLNKIWGYDSDVETRAADDTLKRLRKKISHTDISIETVWGFGFRLKEK